MDKGIFLSYYGDDFTGSTDVLEALTTRGVPAALFMKPPAAEEVEQFRLKNCFDGSDGKLRAFGVAGISRTMSVSEMEAQLPSILERISAIPSQFFHYKICSTFDSSPERGNIGYAVDIALRYFTSQWIPLIVGAPQLNRYCVFGNLFASVNGVSYRLDRHPTMSKHPATPMKEGDLRVHLGFQTKRKVELVDVLQLSAPDHVLDNIISRTIDHGDCRLLLIDILDNGHLMKAGSLLRRCAAGKRQFVVGSSAVEYALLDTPAERPAEGSGPGRAQRLVVLAGSCSPATRDQIEWARANGFEGIRINTTCISAYKERTREIERVVALALSALEDEKPVVLYTALGPDDEMIRETRKVIECAALDSSAIGEVQAEILKKLIQGKVKTRVAVAGGDTSGYITQALDIYALELSASIAPGAPLCLAHSTNPDYDGMEIALKGGQNGNERYFGCIMEGSAY